MLSPISGPPAGGVGDPSGSKILNGTAAKGRELQ